MNIYIFILCTENQQNVKMNIALRKKSSQSSKYWKGEASLAVDGSTNPFYYDRSCSHTLMGNLSWWQVDLGDLYNVAAIIIYNRIASYSKFTCFQYGE